MSDSYTVHSVERFENADGWHQRILAVVNGVPVQVVKADDSDWVTVKIDKNIVHLPPDKAAQWILDNTDAR